MIQNEAQCFLKLISIMLISPMNGDDGMAVLYHKCGHEEAKIKLQKQG